MHLTQCIFWTFPHEILFCQILSDKFEKALASSSRFFLIYVINILCVFIGSKWQANKQRKQKSLHTTRSYVFCFLILVGCCSMCTELE